jgi:hypothetical protein
MNAHLVFGVRERPTSLTLITLSEIVCAESNVLIIK